MAVAVMTRAAVLVVMTVMVANTMLTIPCSWRIDGKDQATKIIIHLNDFIAAYVELIYEGQGLLKVIEFVLLSYKNTTHPFTDRYSVGGFSEVLVQNFTEKAHDE